MTKVSTITPCYNMARYMEGFLLNLSEQTHEDLEVVLDHNNPTDEEVAMVQSYNEIHDNIFHIQVEGVDPIGVSMNRCIENASGDYLCIWNVDDLRTPRSIEIMANTLDENPDVDFVYGNFIIVPTFGGTQGQLVDETGKEEWLTKGMILGPFFMFRKSAIKKSGMFDEQLVSGADFDLALRLAFNGKGLHIPEILGYYLNEGMGASTRPNSKQPLERTVIELRYGLNVLEPHLIPDAMKYDVENIIVDDIKTPALSYKK
jgi:glycosyltransferase involved in cell wall biosynthesis